MHIASPSGYSQERKYVLEVVFKEFLGLEFTTSVAANKETTISVGNDSGRCVRIPDVLFAVAPDRWLTEDILPVEPILEWRLPTSVANTDKPLSVPMLYQDKVPPESCHGNDNVLRLPFDVLGAIFFMLTRLEEVVSKERDRHDRFPFHSAIAYRCGFLHRAVVNEYVELLWTCLKWLGICQQRKRKAFSVVLSHDVDLPLVTPTQGMMDFVRSCAGDAIKRRDPILLIRRTLARLPPRHLGNRVDPYNTFSFIMDVSERHGLKSSFNFIPESTAGMLDCCYSLDDPWIRGLMEQIGRRGHEIGFHPSYYTLREPLLLEKQYARLRDVADTCGIRQEKWGGRQHYLRWANPESWRYWDRLGLDYDSSLGFADAVGFRCGVCYEFPVFDLELRQPLRLRERSLIVMDIALSRAERLATSQMSEQIRKLAEECRRFSGEFTMLWHNNYLASYHDKSAYDHLVTSLLDEHSYL